MAQGKRHFIVPDLHVKPGTSNRRAEWIGRAILDHKPDVVVVLGDAADMESLCSYDKGTKAFQGRSYKADIDSHIAFQEVLWDTVRQAKKRLPLRVILEGNHEYRITRAINTQPELEGAIGFEDLELDRFYDRVVRYQGNTPGVVDIDGISYAHYLVSGVSGRPISGEHLAYSLLAKQHASCVVGHNHTFDYCIRTRVDGRRIQAVCAGVCQEHVSEFAGEAQKLWWNGVVILENVVEGTFDLTQISLDQLKKRYG
jgi:hypothetical protein